MLKKFFILSLIGISFTSVAQSNADFALAVVELEDVMEFLSKHTKESILLKETDGYTSLETGESTSMVSENQSVMIFDSKTNKGKKIKIEFSIDDYVFGKAIISTTKDPAVRKVSMVAGEGKNKSKMVSVEF